MVSRPSVVAAEKVVDVRVAGAFVVRVAAVVIAVHVVTITVNTLDCW